MYTNFIFKSHNLAVFVIAFLIVTSPAIPNAASINFVINEVVGDAQLDWSQSAGGSGNPFDGTPGVGSVSTSDEYIELKNISSSTQSLEGFILLMDDSTPVNDCFTFLGPNDCEQSSYYRVFNNHGGMLSGTTGTLLTNVPAGGYVVLGNPFGNMSNDVSLTLFDGSSNTIDAVSFGSDAPSLNSTSPLDEAIARFPDGFDTDSGTDFFAQPSSLGVSNVPIPGAVWLLGSGLVALVELRRRFKK